jgi:excisionase family DNA binding protein
MEERNEESGLVSTPLFSVSEGAKYLGVGRKVLYQLIERGEITVVKSKGTTLIEKRSLDKFLASGKLT